MHFFITGHTGFKGAWLTLLLKELGHEVSGYSLEPAAGSLFERARVQNQILNHYIADIREFDSLKLALQDCQPDFAVHLAAQPLVLRSYADPMETYTTNVDGTRNFLQAITECEKPPVTLVVTTDKVYRDDGKGSYTETDPLGGHDPYSASKAMADILTQSWAATNPQLRLHIARAGNVIGAFDVSQNRLIPDLVRAVSTGNELVIRNPNSVRPWQHVLDCLSGYLAFMFASYKGIQLPTVLNFGPESASIKTVSDVIETAKSYIKNLEYRVEKSIDSSKETQFLTLDSSKAQEALAWKNILTFERALGLSFSELHARDAIELVTSQIKDFIFESRSSWLS